MVGLGGYFRYYIVVHSSCSSLYVSILSYAVGGLGACAHFSMRPRGCELGVCATCACAAPAPHPALRQAQLRPLLRAGLCTLVA